MSKNPRFAPSDTVNHDMGISSYRRRVESETSEKAFNLPKRRVGISYIIEIYSYQEANFQEALSY